MNITDRHPDFSAHSTDHQLAAAHSKVRQMRVRRVTHASPLLPVTFPTFTPPSHSHCALHEQSAQARAPELPVRGLGSAYKYFFLFTQQPSLLPPPPPPTTTSTINNTCTHTLSDTHPQLPRSTCSLHCITCTFRFGRARKSLRTPHTPLSPSTFHLPTRTTPSSHARARH